MSRHPIPPQVAVRTATVAVVALVAVTVAAVALAGLTMAARLYRFSTAVPETAFFVLVALAVLTPPATLAGSLAVARARR